MTGTRRDVTETSSLPTIYAPIEGEACEPIWRILREHIARQQHDGGQVRPAVQRAMDQLRKGAQDHLTIQAMFAREQVSRPIANMAPESIPELLTTQQMADRLHVTPTHARRLAARAGIESLAVNAWRSSDVDALVINRRKTA